MKEGSNKSGIGMIVAMTIFGTIGLVRKMLPGYSSGFVALARGIIGTLFLLIVRLVKKEGVPFKSIKNKPLPLIISGIFIGANWILLFEAYRYTSVSVATICYYMAPVFVIIASPFVTHEKITAKKGICAAVALAGMVLVSGVIETGFSGLTGVMLGLGAAVLYAAAVLLNKKTEGITANDRTFIQLGIASVAIIPYVLLTDNISKISFDAVSVMLLVLAGVLHTGIAYLLYFASLQGISAQSAAILSYIDPALSVLISAFILNEGISVLAIIGVVAVLGSAMISEINFKSKKRITE